MVRTPGITTEIRPFNGSLADAEGLLAVERATFNESPYSPNEVRGMLTHGTQRAWLALSLSATVRFVFIVNTPVRQNRGLPRCLLPGKLYDRSRLQPVAL